MEQHPGLSNARINRLAFLPILPRMTYFINSRRQTVDEKLDVIHMSEGAL